MLWSILRTAISRVIAGAYLLIEKIYPISALMKDALEEDDMTLADSVHSIVYSCSFYPNTHG